MKELFSRDDHPRSAPRKVMTSKRKRCRSESTTTSGTNSIPSSPSSWVSLLWKFSAAAAVVASSSSTYFVEGQQQERQQQQQQKAESSSLLRAAAATSTGTIRSINRRATENNHNNRAFIRQQQEIIDDDGEKHRRKSHHHHHPENDPYDGNDKFLDWCQDVLGIDTSLVEIGYFEYPDYIQAMEDRIDIFCEDCDEDNNEDYEDDNASSDYSTPMDDSNYRTYIRSLLDEEMKDHYSDVRPRPIKKSVWDEYHSISVRGLKASRFISKGETVLSIPQTALWTIHNVIDKSGDARLITAMGPEARLKHGWESPGMDEIPLLALTVLYHKHQLQHQRLEKEHPRGSMHYRPYLEMIWKMEEEDDFFEDDDRFDLHRRQVQRIPHLWSSRKLKTSATESVRRVAEGIRQDVVELYESIVLVLIEEHPDIFGPPGKLMGNFNEKQSSNEATEVPIERNGHETSTPGHETNTHDDDDNNFVGQDDEWMFSLENFHWAFALVNSRHWHLQIPDVPNAKMNGNISETSSNVRDQPNVTLPLTDEESVNDKDEVLSKNPEHGDSVSAPITTTDDHESFTDQEGPPAATPTDEWVGIQDKKLREEEERELKHNDKLNSSTETTENETLNETINKNDAGENFEDEEFWPPGNSFLAPLADLLNFGPPCTRGMYNEEKDAFEIVATCDFQEGQEITFWYTDDCEDVFVANYGFTMPMMVPKCDDYGKNSNDKESTKTHFEEQENLEDELFHAYDELDRMSHHVDLLLQIIEDCHCGNQTDFGRHVNGNGSTVSEKPRPAAPLPRSPSPPMKKEYRESAQTIGNNRNGMQSSTFTTATGDISSGNHAQHAIRNGNNNSGGSSKRGRNKGHRGEDNGPGHQHHHRQRHHRTKTRTRSRSHQDRILEF